MNSLLVKLFAVNISLFAYLCEVTIIARIVNVIFISLNIKSASYTRYI